ncbi:hypothetical protein EBT31_15485 [bacterium]|nr:hypothetical protein [bacterium]NBX51817.1 hypothetical protein [bacterium]
MVRRAPTRQDRIRPMPRQREKRSSSRRKKLYSDYRASGISADNTYKRKLVEVSGTVDNIGKDILDKPYISLKTGDIIGSVQCMSDDAVIAEASALAEGTKVTTCKVT